MSTQAERQRDRRRRRREGKTMVKIEIDLASVADGISRFDAEALGGELLGEWDVDDPVKAKAAIERFLYWAADVLDPPDAHDS